MNDNYFFDSYGVIEVLANNKNYEKYSYKNITLTKLNLFEIYHSVLRDSGEEDAEGVIKRYSPSVIDYDIETIKEAVRFRLHYKKRNLSMTDCTGYVIAKKLGIKFLTGDKEFEDLDNVEFVK